jgi:hypothetical protein
MEIGDPIFENESYNLFSGNHAETQTSIRLAGNLVRVPISRSGGHEFKSPGLPIASKYRKLDARS